MLYLKCTQKLLKELRQKPVEAQPSSWLQSWHGNLLTIERRKCVLFTNDHSFFSVFIPGLKRQHFDHIGQIFSNALFKIILAESLPQNMIEKVLDEAQEFKIGKTDNRRVTGTMVELVKSIDYFIWDHGGLINTDIIELNLYINRIVHLSLKEHTYAYEAFIKRLQNL